MKKQNVKKLLSFALAAVMSASLLAGCGNSKEESKESKEVKQPKELKDINCFDYVAESKDTLFKRISVLNALVKNEKKIVVTTIEAALISCLRLTM